MATLRDRARLRLGLAGAGAEESVERFAGATAVGQLPISRATPLLAARLPIADQFVDPVFDWQPFAWALAVAVVLSALGGILPAWRASRISPVEALRYE